MMNVGKQIKAARQAAGLTIEAAAKRAGWTAGRWGDLEADRYSPRVTTISRAAEALGVELITLFKEDR